MPPAASQWAAALLAVALLGPSACVAAPREATLTAVGDVLLARAVGVRIARGGADWPWGRVRGLLTADITVGNLECVLGSGGMATPKRYVFQGKPGWASGMRHAGFGVVSLANNHTLDYDRPGLGQTMSALQAAGVGWCGAGQTAADAERAHVVTVRGLRIAFVGLCEFVPEVAFPDPDSASIVIATPADVRRVVLAARRSADVVVAQMHWGREYEPRPSPRQRALARAAVEAGADLVLGHHPHVLEGLEWIPRRVGRSRRWALVAYSLGNFVFDPRGEAASNSMVLRCVLDAGGVVSAEVLPVRVEGCRPAPAGPVDAAAILARTAALSSELGAHFEGAMTRRPETQATRRRTR